MRSNRNSKEQAGAGWLYADVLLGLLLIFLASAEPNKPRDPDNPDAIAPECSADVERKPIKMTLNWSSRANTESLIKGIEKELKEAEVAEDTNVGLILAYGGSQGSNDESAAIDRSKRVIEELRENWDRFGQAYSDPEGAFDRSLNNNEVKLKLFMEQECP